MVKSLRRKIVISNNFRDNESVQARFGLRGRVTSRILFYTFFILSILYIYFLYKPFNICCPRDCVSRHNGGTSGAPLKPLRVDSALKPIHGDVDVFVDAPLLTKGNRKYESSD